MAGTPRQKRPGHFGRFGGMFVPETLMARCRNSPRPTIRQKRSRIPRELDDLLHDYVGRPTPLYFAERWTEKLGGAKIYLKREDLLHTGAHKINNALGQILLAKRLGKKRIIAETGAGQHGVATATVCARFGMECVVYMGKVDMERQALNVARMRLMGAEVRAVTAGQATLKEAVNEAMRDWVASVDHTHYILGSALGSHPFPDDRAGFPPRHRRRGAPQILEKEGRLPDLLVACVGGGSNAIGLFHPFLAMRTSAWSASRPAATASSRSATPPASKAANSACCKAPKPGCSPMPTARSNSPTRSAGLDYAAVGPEHAYLQDIGRVEYTYATDAEALAAFKELAHCEGIIPALESAHAMAYVSKSPAACPRTIIIANLSGRGDKDVEQASKYLMGSSAHATCSNNSCTSLPKRMPVGEWTGAVPLALAPLGVMRPRRGMAGPGSGMAAAGFSGSISGSPSGQSGVPD
jgi:tryptophan synthase beta chain